MKKSTILLKIRKIKDMKILVRMKNANYKKEIQIQLPRKKFLIH